MNINKLMSKTIKLNSRIINQTFDFWGFEREDKNCDTYETGCMMEEPMVDTLGIIYKMICKNLTFPTQLTFLFNQAWFKPTYKYCEVVNGLYNYPGNETERFRDTVDRYIDFKTDALSFAIDDDCKHMMNDNKLLTLSDKRPLEDYIIKTIMYITKYLYSSTIIVYENYKKINSVDIHEQYITPTDYDPNTVDFITQQYSSATNLIHHLRNIIKGEEIEELYTPEIYVKDMIYRLDKLVPIGYLIKILRSLEDNEGYIYKSINKYDRNLFIESINIVSNRVVVCIGLVLCNMLYDKLLDLSIEYNKYVYYNNIDNHKNIIRDKIKEENDSIVKYFDLANIDDAVYTIAVLASVKSNMCVYTTSDIAIIHQRLTDCVKDIVYDKILSVYKKNHNRYYFNKSYLKEMLQKLGCIRPRLV